METLRQAIDIIENVRNTTVWLNKNQCERVKKRFAALDVTLRRVKSSLADDKDFGGENANIVYPAFDELLTVLRKGNALISQYRKWSAIKTVLNRTDNVEAFKEIHGEIDALKSNFYFDSEDNYNFEATTGAEREAILVSDAEGDRKEMSEELHRLERIEEAPSPMQEDSASFDLKKVKEVVNEKFEAAELGHPKFQAEQEFPSYLSINPSIIETKDPVRPLERLSEADPIALHGLTLVHKGCWLGCECAIKVFKSPDTQWNMDRLSKEIGLLINLRHPHIVQLIGFAHDAEKSYVLMELMDGDLRNFMKNRLRDGKSKTGRPFTYTQALDIITQIAKGMYYLHRQKYIHGELKCSNVLVKESGDHIDVKITDFHCARQLGEARSASASRPTMANPRPRWTAPEAIPCYVEDEPSELLLQKGDVYSFGLTCYEVLSGKLPFENVRGDELVKRIKSGNRPELPGELNEALKGLVTSCWHPQHESRPTFEEICHVLDIIKSSEPVKTEISSGVEAVRIKLRQLLKVLIVVRKLNPPPPRVEEPQWTNLGGEENQNMDGVTSEHIPKYLRIEPSDLIKGPKIGGGASAEVFEAKWLGCRFAVKRFKAATIDGSALQQEMKFLTQLLHPHIVRLVGFSIQKHECSIVMELMDSDLRAFIETRMNKIASHGDDHGCSSTLGAGPFTPEEALDIIQKIALGMAFLHSKNVLHRDLKARNVLVQNRCGTIDVKIVDFGVSQYFDSEQSLDPSVVTKVGTGFWRAPEILSDPASSSCAGDQFITCDLKAADVYSFAMTCYEVVSGGLPFVRDGVRIIGNSDYDKLRSGVRPSLPAHVNPDLGKLIERCWHGDPKQRPDFFQICQELRDISTKNVSQV